MISNNFDFNAPVRQITAKAELYNSSSALTTIPYDGDLKAITIERVGTSKFFGFGIS